MKIRHWQHELFMRMIVPAIALIIFSWIFYLVITEERLAPEGWGF